MGFYAERILPKLIDLVMKGETFERLRKRRLADLHGTVLEIGIGSGLNLPYYPEAVNRVLAVEPSVALRAMATARAKGRGLALDFVGEKAEAIALADGSVTQAVSTWTLCTIPDLPQALAEISRVLQPGGRLLFVEHGRSPLPRVALWQDRLTPLQKRLGGGCHLNRPIDRSLLDAGFRLDELENFYVKGPKVATYQYYGVARKI